MRRFVALALLVAACAESVPPAPPPDSLRADAAAAMAAVETAAFSITREGAPISISGLEFSSATGAYSAPDRAEAVLEVKVADVQDLGHGHCAGACRPAPSSRPNRTLKH